MRRHGIRFPKRKIRAVRLAHTIDWMTVIRDLESLSGKRLQEEREARIRVMKKTFGMGLKTTGDFLKDIGFSKHLAVLDSRNSSFLKALGPASEKVEASKLSSRGLYYELEDIEKEIADQMGITVSELDERIMTYTGTPREPPHRI